MENNKEIKTVTRTFDAGMNQDAHTSQQPESTIPFALNVINKDSEQTQFKSNEHGNKKVITFPSDIIGKVHQDEYNRTFYLLANGSIWMQDHNTETAKIVAEASEFECDWSVGDCERVDMVVYTNNSDTYLQWSSNWIYYIVNISEMLSPERKAALIKEITSPECSDCGKNCNYFRVFKPKCPPILKAEGYSTGGSLTSGAYFYSVRQVNRDGSRTTWSTPSTKPAYVYSYSNITGEPANGRVEIEVSDLSCSYEQIEIAIIYQSNAQTSVKVYGPVFFTGTKYTYTHLSDVQTNPISFEELSVNDSQNYEGKYQTLFNNKMFYYGIRPHKEFNVQSIANKIKVRFFAEKYSLDLIREHQIQSLPRGESLSFGIWLNEIDGNKTYAGIIPCSGGGGTSKSGLNLTIDGTSNQGLLRDNKTGGSGGSILIPGDTATGGSSTSTGGVTISFSRLPKYERSRDPGKREETVQEPDNKDRLLTHIETTLVDSYNTEVADLVSVLEPAIDPNQEAAGLGFGGKDPEECCDDPKDENNTFAESKKQEKDAAIVNKDLLTAEEIGTKWGSVLSDLISDGSVSDIALMFTPTNIKQLTKDIIDAVKRREDVYITPARYNVAKTNDYDSGESITSNSPLKGGTINTFGPNTGNPSKPYTTQYSGGSFVGYYDAICSPEDDTTYPCVADCKGQPIFGSLAGQKVTNHEVPDESIIPIYVSHSVGVKSEATPDADEYADGYGIIVGAEFLNIDIDYDEYYKETGRKLCPTNTYTIGMVKLSDHNKNIITKGSTFGGYVSSNQGKNYIYQCAGANSFERCDKHIDKGDKVRMDPGAPTATSCFMYGLDQSALKPAVQSAETLTHFYRTSGIGFRHNQYAEGTLPQNKFLGRRIDITGTVQSININKPSNVKIENTVGGVKYVKPDSVAAPPAGGGNIPLMNKYGQDCLWIANSGAYDITDKSFVGDVLIHPAPIIDAACYHSVLSRKLANQYGAVENRSFIPKISGNSSVARGFIGNRFISPYSFVKTNWISDKIGDKFQISAMLPGKEDRCICDTPEDAINKSKYFWTQTPKSGDIADAKNWCGLHTVGGATGTLTRDPQDAAGQNATESDMYGPGFLTTLITVWGEWETNPWGVEISDKLNEQRYQYMRPIYDLGSQIDGKRDWTNGFLDQIHIKRKQPSGAERTAKILIDSIIPMVVSILKLEQLLNSDGALDLTGNIASVPIYVALIAIFAKVLFTEDFIYDILGFPKCRTQTEGGIDFNVEGFFTNINRYSSVFNREMDLIARPQITTIQGCNNNDFDHTINKIVISDSQVETSIINGYTVVKPLSHVTISNDAGDLKDLFALNGKLYGHTTEGIYLLYESQQNRTADVLQAIYGIPDQLFPVLIIGSNPEGMGGLRSKTHSLLSQLGKAFIDYDGDAAYIFTGSDLKPISLNGMYTFFKKYIKYCDPGDCVDANKGDYFALGYDPVIQRLLITKGNKESSWTLSYDPYKGENGSGEWVSFHSFVPNDYLSTRNKYYHLTNDSVYLHDPRDHGGEYGKFFDNNYPTIFDVKHTFPQSGQYHSHLIGSDVEVHEGTNHLYARDFTFDELAFWNSRQTGGYHKLDATKIINKNSANIVLKDNYSVIPAVKELSHWKVNEMYDYTNDPEGKLIEFKDKCSYFYEPVNYIPTEALFSQNSKHRRLSGNWFITRLLWNNSKKFTKIYLKYLTLNVSFKNE